jgi:transcriptional regulator with XRE-family HTH domain
LAESPLLEDKSVIIGDRLRTLREAKNFTQGEVEKRTGLLRTYVSRVENGHAVPSVETLEKFARALEIPIYQLFYDGDKSPTLPIIPKRKTANDIAWGSSGRDARWLARFRRLLPRTEESDRKILMFMAQQMARRKAV